MAVEIPLLAKYGYDASEEGIHQHRPLVRYMLRQQAMFWRGYSPDATSWRIYLKFLGAAMASLLKDCPDLVEKNHELARLVPGLQGHVCRHRQKACKAHGYRMCLHMS